MFVVVFSDQGIGNIHPVGADVLDVEVMEIVVVHKAFRLDADHGKALVPADFQILHIRSRADPGAKQLSAVGLAEAYIGMGVEIRKGAFGIGGVLFNLGNLRIELNVSVFCFIDQEEISKSDKLGAGVFLFHN